MALYTGPEGHHAAPTAAQPTGVTVTKETTQMPTTARRSSIFIGLRHRLRMFVYRRAAERGFRWVQFDDEGRMIRSTIQADTTVEMNGNGGSHGHVVSPFDKV